MTEFSDWIQTNWFELGILLVLTAILAALIWFAQNILKALRASQEQLGALLRLSFSEVVPVQPAVTQTRDPTVAELPQRGPNRLIVATRKLIHWLGAPMGSGSHLQWRKVVRWLQAPVRS